MDAAMKMAEGTDAMRTLLRVSQSDPTETQTRTCFMWKAAHSEDLFNDGLLG